MSDTLPIPVPPAPETATPAAPAPTPAAPPRKLTGTYLSWLQWTQAEKHARTILLNLGLRYGQHTPIIARFVDPPGFGFSAPNAAYLNGVTGFSTRENPTLAEDSPTPMLIGPAEALAFDVRMRLSEMPGAVSGRTKLQEVEDEILAAGGAVALDMFRFPGHRIDRMNSVEVEALRAVDLTERDVADLFTRAFQRGQARDEARVVRRTATEKTRGKGKGNPPSPPVAAGAGVVVEVPQKLAIEGAVEAPPKSDAQATTEAVAEAVTKPVVEVAPVTVRPLGVRS